MPNRTTSRNGTRQRPLESAVGMIDLAIPKLRNGSYIQSFIEPRRMTDKALISVIVLQASFNQRRKTLLNSLGGSGFVPGGKTTLEEILVSEGISVKCRAEELNYLQFLAISEKIMQKNNQKQ